MAAKFCFIETGCGESMNTEEFDPLLARNLKELLPDNTQFRASLYSNFRGGAEAFIMVRFKDQDIWADWSVMDSMKNVIGQWPERQNTGNKMAGHCFTSLHKLSGRNNLDGPATNLITLIIGRRQTAIFDPTNLI